MNFLIIRKKNLQILPAIFAPFLLLILVLSCGKEEFKTNPKTKVINIDQTLRTTSDLICSRKTDVKPKVDFLFVWDNSASQYFVTSASKTALNNIINQVSERFDYRILIAPLIVEDYSNWKVNDEAFLVAENISGISGEILTKIKPQSEAIHLLNFTQRGGSREKGLSRTYQLLNQNIDNGVFRKNSYTIIVLMSNGNENSYIPEGRPDNGGASYFAQQKNNFLYLRNSRLNALQMRFMSIVAHSSCVTGFKSGRHYINMSKELYTSSYSGGKPSPTDQGNNTTPDSYDICKKNFSNVFLGINSSIKDQILKHTYNYWPITKNTSARINLDAMEVERFVAKSSIGLITRSSINGWEYAGARNLQNTRIQPTLGEPKSGLLIKLNGSGQVTFPECLIIRTQEPADYYGYVHLHSKPALNTINLKIKDINLKQSTTNGWEYIGFRENQNIKIKTPSKPLPDNSFPEYKTGYFLKINGESNLESFTNGASIRIIYTPASN